MSMNAFQTTQQLVWVLSAPNVANGKTTGLVWPGGSAQPVFGKVAVAPDPSAFSMLDATEPFCLVSALERVSMPEHPPDVLADAKWVVRFYAINANDQQGGAPVVGATRRGGIGSSEGRGVLEIEPLVEVAIFGAMAADVRVTGADPVALLDEFKGSIAARAIKLSAAPRMPTQPCFDPVARLLATGGSGVANLAWSLPADRWDLVGIVVRRASGSTAPATPTSGSAVTVGAGLATSVSDSPGAGTWSYSVFGAYDSFRNPLDGSRDAGTPVVTDYSGSGAAQQGFTYRPATATITV